MAPAGYDAEPDHPALPMPAYYEVARVDWHIKEEDPFIDIWVTRQGDGSVARLRFWHPQQVGIDTGFNGFNSGFRIKDISRRGMEVRVAVTSFEQDPAIHFLAARVERVESPLP
jgi:hypothetical protein